MDLKGFTEASAPEVYRHVSKPQPEAASDSEYFSTRPSSCRLHGPERQPQTAAAIRIARDLGNVVQLERDPTQTTP